MRSTVLGLVLVALLASAIWLLHRHEQVTFWANESDKAKMHLVVQEVIRRAQDPADKTAFRAGEIFTSIDGLEMQVIGVAVPMDKSGRRTWISFEPDYFRNTEVRQIAADAIRDFQRAKVESKN